MSRTAATPDPWPPTPFSSFPSSCSTREEEDEEEDLSNNKIVQFCKSIMSFSDTYDGDRFFTVKVRRAPARAPSPQGLNSPAAALGRAACACRQASQGLGC